MSKDLVGKRVRLKLDEEGVVALYNSNMDREGQFKYRDDTYDVQLDNGIALEWVPRESLLFPKTIKPGMRLSPRNKERNIHDLVVVRKHAWEEDTWYLVNWMNPDMPSEKLTEDELDAYDEVTE